MSDVPPKRSRSVYDYESCPDRHHTQCYKYDTWKVDVIPLCIADMDVRAAPEIIDALSKRVQHGVFGYGHDTKKLTQTAVRWLKVHQNWDVEEDWIVWFPGIVSGMNIFLLMISRLFPDNKELKAIVNTPAYPPFLSAPGFQKQTLLDIPLCEKREGQKLIYSIDWDAMEKAVTKDTKCLIFCNPHNPSGRVWTVDEMKKLADFCERHNLYVLSDEIWADLVLEKTHVPFAHVLDETSPLEKRVVTTMAPSKTFNIAGLCCSIGIIPDKDLREAFKAAAAGIVPGINCMGLEAAEVAWNGTCDEWHRQLLDHLRSNLSIVEKALARCPNVFWSHPEGTFVVWVDVRKALPKDVKPEDVTTWFADKYKVGLSNGSFYGRPGYVRINIGYPTKVMTDAMEQFVKAFSH